MDEKISITKFFAGKNIFITGGSGFIGKVLIEKLLRSCPDLGNIYVLIRSKKGKNSQERLVEQIVNSKLFKTLKKENEKALGKLIAVEGDVMDLDLGLSKIDRQTLIDNVNIIYHSAASVRFDDFMKDSILVNTRSTREITYLAKELKNLDVFMHVSTTYSQCDKLVIEEEMYPPPGDWKEAIELAENYDSELLNILTEKYKGALPNTYTFTKSLAEHVVYDLCNNQIPAIILRPSIVIPTYSDPVAGWMDNFYGPVGMCVATGKGILRSVYTPPSTKTEYIPVDLVVKIMISSTWEKGVEKDLSRKLKTEVYNASNNTVAPLTYKELMECGAKMYKECPLNNVIWYPHNEPTACWYNHFYKLLFYQLLPALLIDGMLRIAGKKPIVFKLHRRIYIANMALQYFLNYTWVFKNKKTLNLERKILPEDMVAFSSYRELDQVDIFDFFWKVKLGARKYLLNEGKETFEAAKRHTMRMWYLYIVWNTIWYLTIFYLVFIRFNIIGYAQIKIIDCIDYFNKL
ncbi:unnamed protein product [Brassicogethes aeneus]|uniref:Fatty acyl-CoA reductase n=1 Tax=Brassicogethes aeneus TaxID=1431903 RepID=A0A9P0FEB2_BRAAE|nr:unnamed protein product [Brassicogethes aeneus]